MMKGEWFVDRFTRRDFNGGHLLLAVLGGMVAGAAVAMLTAPRSGRETRQHIATAFKNGGRAVGQLPEALRRGTTKVRKSFWG